MTMLTSSREARLRGVSPSPSPSRLERDLDEIGIAVGRLTEIRCGSYRQQYEIAATSASIATIHRSRRFCTELRRRRELEIKIN